MAKPNKKSKQKYLWLAIIFVAIVVVAVALYYYNNQQNDIYGCGPFSCSFGGGGVEFCNAVPNFACLSSFLYSNGTFVLNLQQNSSNVSINITSVGCNTKGTKTNLTQYNPPIYLPIGANATLNMTCYANGTVFSSQPGAPYRGFFVIDYSNGPNSYHTAFGRILEKAS